MGNNVSSNPQRRRNYPDDQMGYEIAIDDACIVYGGGGNGAAEGLVPDNGEYKFSSVQGNCNYCINCMPKKMKDAAGCTPDNLCASGGGGIPYYKRVGYLAPKDQCCLNPGAKEINGKTCDPKYRGGAESAECAYIYQINCNDKDKIFGDTCKAFCNSGRDSKCNNILNNLCTGDILSSGNETCTNWCDKNPELCKTRIRSYCQGNNLDKRYCKDKLIDMGYSDTPVNEWCASHVDDPFCACYKALHDSGSTVDPTAKAVLSRPECYVSECASGLGYKYTNMRQGNVCPPANVCVNKIAVAGNEYANLQNVKQECNQEMKISTGDQASTDKKDAIPMNVSSGNTNQAGTPVEEQATLFGVKLDFMGEYTMQILIFIIAVIISLILLGMSLSEDAGPSDLASMF